MKNNKYTAILGNAVGYPEMGSLTDHRPLASLPFDGKYRLMDFQLSSLANAGIRSAFAICKRKHARSVFDHIRSGREWGLNTLLSHFFFSFHHDDLETEVADADYYDQILTYLKRSGSDQTIYMSCDILANINLKQIIHLHTVNQRDITVVYKNVPGNVLSQANIVLQIDEADNVIGTGPVDAASASQAMGAEIYVVNTSWLIEKMEEERLKAQPLKLRYLLRELIVSDRALAYEYTGYLSNITSVASYYRANMDMLDPNKFHSLLYANQKVYTKVKNEEATYFADGSKVTNSQFSSGSIIEGEVDHAIVSRNCRVAAGARLAHSVVFPKVKIEEGATVEYAIIDKLVTVPAGVTIRGTKDKPIVIGKGQEITGDMIG